jgi:hypothetical protein
MRVASSVWFPFVFAGVGANVPISPPEGWANVCVGEALDVTPSTASRRYSGTGSCWVNTAQNKTDGTQQNWVRAALTFTGTYDLKSSTYSERLTLSFQGSNGPANISVTTNGTCGDDPWATESKCSSSPPNVTLTSSFGWQTSGLSEPLSRNVYGPALVSAMLKKQASTPPLAPVDLDAVRWPSPDGNGNVGRVFWRAPDISGNQWILGYDIEYAINSTDSGFSHAGHVVGPGPKTTMSLIEMSRFFYTPFKLLAGDYYFRVCTTNDAGRQCSAAVKAREPSKTELIAIAHNHTQLKITPDAGSAGR